MGVDCSHCGLVSKERQVFRHIEIKGERRGVVDLQVRSCRFRHLAMAQEAQRSECVFYQTGWRHQQSIRAGAVPIRREDNRRRRAGMRQQRIDIRPLKLGQVGRQYKEPACASGFRPLASLVQGVVEAAIRRLPDRGRAQATGQRQDFRIR